MRARSQRGFTLIEIIIVLAVLAVLAAVAIPNVTGFLGRGKREAFEADQRLLQAAVDGWRTDIRSRAGNPWPTVGGVKGTPTDANDDDDFVDGGDTNSFIKISELVDGGYLKGYDVVKSFKYAALVTGATGATNSPVGSYYWYVNTNGVVTGWYDTNDNKVVDGGETGFQTDIYP